MQMKTFMLILSMGVLSSVNAIDDTRFSGRWSGEQEGRSTLTLVLKQNDNKLTGSYCFISRAGTRIDCPDDGENNLRGVIVGNGAKVTFTSSFKSAKGVAKITLEDNVLKWRLVKSSSLEISAPEHYSLIKDN